MRGTNLTSLALPDIIKWDKPARLSFAGKTPGFAMRTPDGLAFSSVLEKLGLSRALVGKTKRKYDQVIRGLRLSRLMFTPATAGKYKAEITIPDGYEISVMPKDVVLMSDYGLFTVFYKLKGNKIHVERTIFLPIQTIPAKGYSNFVQFCR